MRLYSATRWKKFTSTYYTLKYAFSNKNFKLTHYCYNRNKKDCSKQEQSHFKIDLYNRSLTLSQLRHNSFNLLGSMNACYLLDDLTVFFKE